MDKRLINIIIILLGTITLMSCSNGSSTGIVNNQPIQQEIMYHKTIEVKVVEVQRVWVTNKETVWSIKFRNDEYNLEKTVQTSMSNMGSTPYAYECSSGDLKANSIIKAELYSWKQGEIITRREMGELIK